MELGHDDLSGGNAFLRVHVDRNSAPVIAHGNRIIGVNFHPDKVRMTGQGLVDAVIHGLVDHVVQTGPVIGVTDIHAGALADSIQALENFDGIGAVLRFLLLWFSHAVKTFVILPVLYCPLGVMSRP